ncbi:hypothetical protein GCM10022251_75690 [Phytohabitans flavus]|uniref:Uncharacterized protein n=1 Tax=Phytohabitans flavus TaxID=1076124 RepID=A0A6F8XMF3_9ACTN|nr:hypothetical protein [Phytohabitans flavus]BCB75004.1 hypothetical protein Pflav_014140 [Phytohabitans flavus]
MGNRSATVRRPRTPAPGSIRDEPPPVRANGDGPARQQDTLSEDGLGWIGAHGGAGATTLTRLLGGIDIGCRWPDAMLAEPARVMMVGRTNMEGLRAVSRALLALREGRHPAGMRLMGVVLMADAPGWLPVQLTSRIRLLRSIAPVYRVPWIPSFRLGEMPKRLPKQLVRLSPMADSRPEPYRRRS